MQYVPADQLVETIIELDNKFRFFHLSPCICGAPMWKQPCSICGYYPQWNDDRKYMAETGHDPHLHLRDSCSRERFISAVERSGNFLEFYLQGFEQCIDPQTKILDAARELSKGLVWTSPDEIWDYYRDPNIDSMGREKTPA